MMVLMVDGVVLLVAGKTKGVGRGRGRTLTTGGSSGRLDMSPSGPTGVFGRGRGSGGSGLWDRDKENEGKISIGRLLTTEAGLLQPV